MPRLFFLFWNAAHTLPYLSRYSMSALRDGALCGCSLFIEGINSLVQAAKAKARGYRSTRNLIAIVKRHAIGMRIPVNVISHSG
jgi:hypothetical protein